MKEIPSTIEDIREGIDLSLARVGINPDLTGNSPQNSHQASEHYFLQTLSGKMLQALENGQLPQSQELYNDPKVSLANELVAKGNVGMILIRPDMYHNSEAFRDYLEGLGYSIILDKDKLVDMTTYEDIYGEAIIEPNARPAMPSRTMVYTASTSRLIVFEETDRLSNETLPDEFTRLRKGNQGIPDNKTIRGKIVYDEAKSLGYHNLDARTIRRALDPISAYQHIVNDKKVSGPHSHLPKVDQLLQYTGVGVHVPDSLEILRDMTALCTKADIQEALFSHKFPNINKYNALWKKGDIDTPLVFLISGYAGTGKSTLAKKIGGHFPFINVMPTGILRSIAQESVSKAQNPYLYSNTYDLRVVGNDPDMSIEERFRRQVHPVSTLINQLISFAATEHQHYVLDGNHIMPDTTEVNGRVIPIELYLSVPEVEDHKNMLTGPTHNRSMSETQFEDGRRIHDYMITEAQKHGKLVLPYNIAYEKAMAHIEQKLTEFLKNK